MFRTGSILLALGLSSLTGGMLFFGAVMAPLVFLRLPLDIAGPFIRTLFPFYYGYIIATASLGAVGFVLRHQAVSAALLLLIGAVTLWLWFLWIPHLDAMRAAGNMAGFDLGHTFSVWVNGAQLCLALGLLLRTAVQKNPR